MCDRGVQKKGRQGGAERAATWPAVERSAGQPSALTTSGVVSASGLSSGRLSLKPAWTPRSIAAAVQALQHTRLAPLCGLQYAVAADRGGQGNGGERRRLGQQRRRARKQVSLWCAARAWVMSSSWPPPEWPQGPTRAPPGPASRLARRGHSDTWLEVRATSAMV